MVPLLLAGIGIAIVVGGIVALRLHAFVALLLAALVIGAITPASTRTRYAEQAMEAQGKSPAETAALVSKVNAPLGTRVALAFGEAATGIGILIALASILGKCLLDSGAADRIVRTLMRTMGEKSAPGAFWLSGFVLGIPVFFDTVFYLMIPLAKAARIRSGKSYFFYIGAIVAGGTLTHCMIPPTPGPLAVATQLGVDLGQMIGMGIVIGLIGSAAGFIYAGIMNAFSDIPLRDTPDAPVAEMERITQRDDRDLPPFLLSLLPVILPVILIAGFSIVDVLWKTADPDTWQKDFHTTAGILGDKNIAMAISTALAIFLVVWKGDKTGKPLGDAIQDALASAGVIILITCAGASFGTMLTYTGVGGELAIRAKAFGIPVLLLGWIMTALLRTAQGSSTVAMITAAGMLGGLTTANALGFSPLWMALAFGAGAMPFSWMNDSGFWIVSRMGGLTYGETFKSFSYVMCVMSVFCIVAILIGSQMMPFPFGAAPVAGATMPVP